MWYNWDTEQFIISITTDRAKYKNLVRDSRMNLYLDNLSGYSYVVAEGKAEIRHTHIREETGNILAKYRRKGGGVDDLKQLKKRPRVFIILKPSRMERRGLVEHRE